MAAVHGKCPLCGAAIKVNDEKETGFCSQCGKQIDIKQSISMAHGSEDKTQTQSEQQGQRRTSTSQRRENREREAEEKAMLSEANQKILDLFQFCSSEEEFLQLRVKVMSMDVSEREKGLLLSILDDATKQRLKNVLEKAKKYESSQESPVSGIVGCVVIAIIGIAIGYFLSARWPGIVGIAIAVIGIIGVLMEKLDKKGMEENRKAAVLIEEYRKQGYKL